MMYFFYKNIYTVALENLFFFPHNQMSQTVCVCKQTNALHLICLHISCLNIHPLVHLSYDKLKSLYIMQNRALETLGLSTRHPMERQLAQVLSIVINIF